MFKKLINKIIMGTKCYLALKQAFADLKHDNACLEDELSQTKISLDVARECLKSNKTTARRIIRIVNGLIKREDSVQATKEIKALCNEIIKGE